MNWIKITSLSLLLFSCAKKPIETPQEKKVDPNKPRLVGRIASVEPNRKFALIQAYGAWNVKNGSILSSYGTEGRSANLLVTGEKLGQFAAADIQSGTLEIGDSAYTAAVISEPESPDIGAEEELEKPAEQERLAQ